MMRMVIYLDGSSNDEASLRLGRRICESVEGTLSVLHLRLIEKSMGSVKQVLAVADHHAEISHQVFNQVCGDCPWALWIETEQTFAETIRQQGLVHDLTILERISEVEGPEVLALNIALFESGAPVLVSPPHTPTEFGRKIAIAWSPTIQSMRAIRSGLPFLKQAESVTVLVNSEQGSLDSTALDSYLASHGITAESRAYEGTALTARGRGRAILEAADAIDAELLIMGAYGQNRLQAFIGLGRATQKVIADSPIPVLLQT